MTIVIVIGGLLLFVVFILGIAFAIKIGISILISAVIYSALFKGKINMVDIIPMAICILISNIVIASFLPEYLQVPINIVAAVGYLYLTKKA